MLPNFRTSGLVTVSKLNVSALRYVLFNSMCVETNRDEVVESPELPSWVKTGASSQDNTDDFVIPSLANWVETHSLADPRKSARQILSEDSESDVDKICKILKYRYLSPEDAARSLQGCSFSDLSSTVEQVLKRFSSDWVSAFGFFKWAELQTAYQHSPEMCDFMVDILGKCKKFELMWDLIKEKERSEGYVSLVTLTKAMRRLAKARLYDEAVSVFQGMEDFGVSKDVSAMNNLMEALVKENNVEHAYEIFLDFKDSIPPNAQTFNILIHGWCKFRKLETARLTLGEMERHGFSPNVFSYTCFIEAHCRDKDFRNVKAVLDEMKKRNCRPNVVTYTIVMHTLGKAKQVSEAMEMYEKMKEIGCAPDTPFYNSLIFILGKAGRLKEAREVFDDMATQAVPRDTLTYTTMITCACTHSEEETALGLLKEMEEGQCKPNLETYAPLLKMCCKKKRMKVLYFLLDHMFSNDVSIEAGTYSLLVTGLCKSGKLEDACVFFEEMVSKGMVPRDDSFERLSEELELKNMVEAKDKIVKLMSLAKQRLLC